MEQADGVSKTQLTSLHERVSDSQIFRLRDNATQHEAVLAMINSLDTGDICVPWRAQWSRRRTRRRPKNCMLQDEEVEPDTLKRENEKSSPVHI